MDLQVKKENILLIFGWHWKKDGSGCLSLRDNGVKFNPLEYRNRDTQYGLAIIRGISEKIDYHYVASMNCLNVMIR